jgi:hypothetical protein
VKRVTTPGSVPPERSRLPVTGAAVVLPRVVELALFACSAGLLALLIYLFADALTHLRPHSPAPFRLLGTVQFLTHTDRFKCAVLQSPAISDWALEFFLSSDDPGVVRWMYGIAPWQEPALYTSLIPLYHADKVSTPVLLAVGDKEPMPRLR